MGSKRKVWLEEPGRHALHLFKYVRKDRTGRRYGDDWAEKIAAELAPLMGVPVAEVELASRADGPGTISRRMIEADPGYRLVVERAGGLDTPSHLQLLCRLEARLQPGYRPFTDDAFDYVEVTDEEPLESS